MHEKGGLEIASQMDTKYSTRQLYKMLELLDVYDALQEQYVNQEKAKKTKNK